MPKNDTALNSKPSVKETGFDKEGLLFYTLKLRTRTITVTEPTYGVDEIRSHAARKVLAMEIGDADRKNTLLLTYSALAAISTGNVPEPEELSRMADLDVKFWIEYGRKVAPQLFTWMDELELLSTPNGKAKVNKKKGK